MEAAPGAAAAQQYDEQMAGAMRVASLVADAERARWRRPLIRPRRLLILATTVECGSSLAERLRNAEPPRLPSKYGRTAACCASTRAPLPPPPHAAASPPEHTPAPSAAKMADPESIDRGRIRSMKIRPAPRCSARSTDPAAAGRSGARRRRRWRWCGGGGRSDSPSGGRSRTAHRPASTSPTTPVRRGRRARRRRPTASACSGSCS